MRIAVLGGSFDPVHHGHLNMAKEVLKRNLADQVWFMPAQQNPLKERKIQDFDVRAEMIAKAIRPYRRMKLCTLERELPVPSYTIVTVKELKRRTPEHEFYWIIGEDQAAQLHLWKNIDELRELIRFIVFERESLDVTDDSLIWIKGFDHPASSTKVREGRFEYLPKSVLEVIVKNGLYFDQILRHHVSQYRYEHSMAVAEAAVHLAEIYKVDKTKAYVASLMHDVCKEVDDQAMEKWMKICFPEKMKWAKPVWHGWLAYDKLKTMGIYDKEILSAVYHHVLGDGKRTLDKILYVADKANSKRKHDVTEELSVAEQDLDAAMKLIQINYQKRKAASDE